VRILLSEGSSLTARETLTVLGPGGHHLEVMASQRLPVARFSRYVARVHRCPPAGADPAGYLEAVVDVVRRRGIDVLLPTHEQAWLFAVARDRLPAVGLAVAEAAAFDRVEGKAAFAGLCSVLRLPQPAWAEASSSAELAGWEYPYYLKQPFGTAGRGVVLVRSDVERDAAFRRLGAPVLAQEVATGTYGQVAALFARGRLVAVHTSRQVGAGAGGSAAARESTRDAQAQEDVERLGAELRWHGGLTLDYLADGGARAYIECNPRTVEPGNAAAAGVDLPGLQIALSTGAALPAAPVVGRAGVRTHGAMALAIGAAERTGSRRAALGAAIAAARDGQSREVLTPLRADPPSAIPLAVVLARLLLRPRAAAGLASSAVDAYSVGPDAIARV
jgi:biotin carboxylase